MSQHLPLRAVARTAHRKCRFPSSRNYIRPFSSTIAVRGKEDQAGQAPSALKANLAEYNPERMEDIGILPGTFIRAWGAAPSLIPKAGTSLTEALRSRWIYETKYLKSRIQNTYEMLYYKWWLRKGPRKGKPKQVFWHGIVKREGKERYIELYEHLAAGNLAPLREKCTPALLESLQSRIDIRPPGQRQQWTLLTKEPKVRVVSNRMSLLPIGDPNDREKPWAIRQVVLRIAGKQQLKITHPDKDAPVNVANPYNPGYAPSSQRRVPVWRPDIHEDEPLDETKLAERPEVDETEHLYDTELETVIEKDTVEYLVMQMAMQQGFEQSWKALGFANKTTLERIREMEERKQLEEAWSEQQAMQKA